MADCRRKTVVHEMVAPDHLAEGTDWGLLDLAAMAQGNPRAVQLAAAAVAVATAREVSAGLSRGAVADSVLVLEVQRAVHLRSDSLLAVDQSAYVSPRQTVHQRPSAANAAEERAMAKEGQRLHRMVCQQEGEQMCQWQGKAPEYAARPCAIC